MNPIDADPAQLAGRLFDAVLVPLAEARRGAHAAPYFPTGPEAAASSYFTPSSAGRLTARDAEFPGGGDPVALVDALAAHWAAEGDAGLVAAVPPLRAIAVALVNEPPQDANVDIFCYTLF